ncbi:hypothetical protein GA0061099_101344 [Bradyrhizobium yuanmingense]|uniref:Uncharacterized protein n=1 Tax=Bradyrhizobium yuanmingense TaxID=108015 RepID=A0A1C3XEY7_9BRAD|nr:hypothetical protein IQ15_06904 [Bradyrhizobium yuanmingense]SCB50842.1 hypothetical protein GA0061099_101344 [Bradyrhizobium yuanmingense]
MFGRVEFVETKPDKFSILLSPKLRSCRIMPKPTSKSVQTASGRSVAAYSLEAHTRDNLLCPIASMRALWGKLSMRFAPGGIAISSPVSPLDRAYQRLIESGWATGAVHLLPVIKRIVGNRTLPRKVKGLESSRWFAVPEGRGAPGCICDRRVLLAIIWRSDSRPARIAGSTSVAATRDLARLANPVGGRAIASASHRGAADLFDRRTAAHSRHGNCCPAPRTQLEMDQKVVTATGRAGERPGNGR